MRTIIELLPLGIGIALVGALTWFLLDRDIGVGKWLLAALLFAHGWVHVMFLFPRPEGAAATAGGTTWPFDMGRSWLIGGAGVDANLLHTVGIVMIVATLVAFFLAALSTVGLLVPVGWWAPLVMLGAAGSTVLLLLFYSPALLLGFAINLVVAGLVLASIWSPAAGIGRGIGAG
jgi:hypothetical protein